MNETEERRKQIIASKVQALQHKHEVVDNKLRQLEEENQSKMQQQTQKQTQA